MTEQGLRGIVKRLLLVRVAKDRKSCRVMFAYFLKRHGIYNRKNVARLTRSSECPDSHIVF